MFGTNYILAMVDAHNRYDARERHMTHESGKTVFSDTPLTYIPVISKGFLDVDSLPASDSASETHNYMLNFLNANISSVERTEGMTIVEDYHYGHDTYVPIPSEVTFQMKNGDKHYFSFGCTVGGISDRWGRVLNIRSCIFDGLECGDQKFPFIVVLKDNYESTYRQVGTCRVPHVVVDNEYNYVSHNFHSFEIDRSFDKIIETYDPSEYHSFLHFILSKQNSDIARTRTILSIVLALTIPSGK